MSSWPGGGVYPRLAHAPVGTADADVLVAAAEAALRVPLEMGKHHQRVVTWQVAPHRHAVKPLAAPHRDGQRVLLVHDVHGAERPAVHLQRAPVLLGGVAVALVVRVGLHDGGLRQVLLHQLLHPCGGDDVGTVLLTGVQLHRRLSPDAGAHLFIGLNEAFRTQVAREVNNGFIASTLFIRHIFVAILAGHGLCHGRCSCY